MSISAVMTDPGVVPVYVLTATLYNPNDDALGGPDGWFELQDSLLALSTHSIQTMVEATHTTIHWAKPETVVEAVAWMAAQAG
jgi:hypothetical protein